VSTLSTHVLDTAIGGPADGIPVTLSTSDGTQLGSGVTDTDGRVARLGPDRLQEGTYVLRFETDAYFASSGVASWFYPEVTITFQILNDADHYHVPLLLSPFGYSTYRGS
jgi:5-hydroxyisourate hydrolase